MKIIYIFLLLFTLMINYISSYTQQELKQLLTLLSTSKTILIGAGAGLSLSAGL